MYPELVPTLERIVTKRKPGAKHGRGMTTVSNYINDLIQEQLFDQFYDEAKRRGISVREAVLEADQKARKAWEDYPE